MKNKLVTETVGLVTIWTGGHYGNYYLKSDGLKFIAGVNCGLTFETYYEVGYSSPNLAVGVDSAYPELLDLISQKVNEFVAECEDDDNDTMKLLLALCEVANAEYNKWLCTPEWYMWKENNEKIVEE